MDDARVEMAAMISDHIAGVTIWEVLEADELKVSLLLAQLELRGQRMNQGGTPNG